MSGTQYNRGLLSLKLEAPEIDQKLESFDKKQIEQIVVKSWKI